MHKVNLEDRGDIKHVHFVGIGGISMSGLAEILKNQGYIVTGSDSHRTKTTDGLIEKGITVLIGQSEKNIDEQIDLIVHTAAISEDNPELVEGRRLGVQIVDRAYLLGLMMKGYRYPVAVAGTHGKTTTTAMITEIFMAAGLDPTVAVGGILDTIGGNYRLGNSEYFIVEACEYYDSFLSFFPHLGIILNIDCDHLDYFGSLENIEKSFNKFAQNIDPSGVLVVHSDVDYVKISDGLKCRVITYGGNDAVYRASELLYPQSDSSCVTSFHLLENGSDVGVIKLRLPGDQIVNNALAACAAALSVGIPFEDIAKGLYNFTGAKRRFEIKGTINGVTVMDDYGHHPTEIKVTLTAARRSRSGRIICVFQPHNYSRTQSYLKELGESFSDADIVVVLDIYSTREKDTGEVHSSQLAEQISQNGKEAYYFSSFESAEKFLFDRCIPNDLLITMGAGDVYLLGEEMLRTDLSTLSTSESET